MLGYNNRIFIALILSGAHGAQHFFTRLVPPLIPILAVEFDLSLWKLGLLISVYSIASGLGQTPSGVLSDKYDRRFILAPGIGILAFAYVIFASAPILGAFAPSFNIAGFGFTGPYSIMCVAMFIAGTGASVTHPTGYPLISMNIDEEWKGRALGMWGSASKVGDAAAPATIGVLILILAWNEILLVLGVIGIFYAVLLFSVLGRKQFETLPVEHASNQTDGDNDEAVDIWSRDKRLFIYPMLVIVLFFTTRMIATKGINTFVPTFIVDTYGYSLSFFGVNFGPESFANFYFSALLLTAAVVQLFTGSITDKFDHRKILIAFLGVSTIALVVLSYASLSPFPLFFVLLVVGGGLWGLNPARDALISDISPPEREGRTFGYLWTVTQIIGSMAPVFIGFIGGITGIQDSFRYLAAATFVASLAITLLFSQQVYYDTNKPIKSNESATKT